MKVKILKTVQSWPVGMVVDVQGGLADYLTTNGFAVATERAAATKEVATKEVATMIQPENKRVDQKRISRKAN